jgi:hypothetical protein
VVPIVKDKSGDLTAADNYRPITLSPVISKLFESFLLVKFSSLFNIDPLQFGFKKKIGCRDAIFIVRQVIDYFISRGSNVYVASLDASKAFDRVNHFKMLTTLLRSNFPVYFVKLLHNWYNKLSVQVRWAGCLSDSFAVKSGVRQGGILSPVLFTSYVNCMLSSLRSKGLGCHIQSVYVGAVLYADDLFLMSLSVFELQRMLDVCGDVGSDIGIKFNSNKSHCMMVGPSKLINPTAMTLNDSRIEWCSKLKYLGVTFIAGSKLTVDLCDVRRKFYASVNSILSKCKFCSDLVKLELMEKHCLPILLYAVESLNLSLCERNDLNSWWNSVYRKIFCYNKWESVKLLIHMLGRTDLHNTIYLRTALFFKHLVMFDSNDSAIYELKYSSLITMPVFTLSSLFSLNLKWSENKIRQVIRNSFHNLF